MKDWETDEKYGADIRRFGAVGDGSADDGAAFQAAFDSGAPLLTIPFGTYRIGKPLRIGSNTRIEAHTKAHIRLGDGVCIKRGEFLLTNKNHTEGDSAITIRGGIWDGNCTGNPRGGAEMFMDEQAVSGTLMNFRKVNNLTLSGLTLRNPTCYYLRLCEVDGFLVEHIGFEAEKPGSNQDGVHVGGFCKNGVIRHLRATPGAPDDDFIALNADDCVTRQENRDMLQGPIENIAVYDISAQNCHTFVRLLSVESPIRNVDISMLRGGCKNCAVNMDGARYCRTPLLAADDPRFSGGAGLVENVRISDVQVASTGKPKALFCIETNVRRFLISGYRFSAETARPGVPCVTLGNMGPHRVVIRGVGSGQAAGMSEQSRCDDLNCSAYTDRCGKEKVVVQADVRTGERLILPEGSFEELSVEPLR